MPEPVVPPGVRTLEVLPRTPAPPPTEETFARKPPWLKVRASFGPNYRELKGLMRDAELHTVCEEAGCPNIFECWEAREATFLIGGERCTRSCPFCQIHTGRPEGYDTDEPRRVAHAVARMGLNFAVITGVARDDLPDGGAWLFAESVRQVRALLPGCGVEVLIPDFRGKPEALRQLTDVAPDVLGHNVETVPRLYKRIRPGFAYAGSLELLARARSWLPSGCATKSNLILGMGETRDEISTALQDLRSAHCDLVTITQYLRPSPRHHPVERWVHPDEFLELAAEAEALGFAGVMSGPLVRSSYRAGRLYQQAVASRSAAL
jgi:lipoic acid synthetase